jgi:TRAP-type C4-dicarboxylate transport system permease large subunit
MMGEMGQITPPFGINTFVIQSVAQDVPLTTIYKGVVPFIITDIFRVALILLFPALALYLPSLLK